MNLNINLVEILSSPQYWIMYIDSPIRYSIIFSFIVMVFLAFLLATKIIPSQKQIRLIYSVLTMIFILSVIVVIDANHFKNEIGSYQNHGRIDDLLSPHELIQVGTDGTQRKLIDIRVIGENVEIKVDNSTGPRIPPGKVNTSVTVFAYVVAFRGKNTDVYWRTYNQEN